MRRYPPVQGARGIDMKDKNARKRLSDAKFVMAGVEKVLLRAGKLVRNPTVGQVTEMAAFAVRNLKLPPSTKKKNGEDNSVRDKEWTSISTLLRAGFRPRSREQRGQKRRRVVEEESSADEGEDLDSDVEVAPPRKQMVQEVVVVNEEEQRGRQREREEQQAREDADLQRATRNSLRHRRGAHSPLRGG